MQLLRSLLFVPGNRSNMLDKVLGLRPDAIVPDMEDSVSAAEKSNAREMIAAYLPQLVEAGHQIVPRVNALDTGLMNDDLTAVIGPHVAAVSVGKINDSKDVRRISDTIGRLELKAGVPVGTTKLILWLETAQAIVNAYSICSASKRVVACAFGAEDFTNDIAIERSESELEVVYPRSVVAVAARAAGIIALETPFFDFKNDAGLRENSITSRNLGFRGRFAIHPSQIETINETYMPSEQEIVKARRVVEVFEKAETQGRAATSLDGMVIDVPVVERARKVLAAAESIMS